MSLQLSGSQLGSPGVSIWLISRPSHSNGARAEEIDISRDFSSEAESETVLPSATEPRRLIAPAWNRIASFSEVFPLPRWPNRATLRILSASVLAMRRLLPPGRKHDNPRGARPLLLLGLERGLEPQDGLRVEL